jgi:hypothetical protein
MTPATWWEPEDSGDLVGAGYNPWIVLDSNQLVCV